MTHTKGPWTTKTDRSLGIYSGELRIATVHNKRKARIASDFDEEQANARLIASAPDLLEALEAVLSTVICNGDMSITYAIDGATRKQIDEAIRKAKGE